MVFHVLIAKFCRGIYISTRRDVALLRVVFTRSMEFTHDVEFTRNENVTFSQDMIKNLKSKQGMKIQK